MEFRGGPNGTPSADQQAIMDNTNRIAALRALVDGLAAATADAVGGSKGKALAAQYAELVHLLDTLGP